MKPLFTAKNRCTSKPLIYLLALFSITVTLGYLLKFPGHHFLTLNVSETGKDEEPGEPFENMIKRMEMQMTQTENFTSNRLWEAPTLLNLNFKWLLNNEDICKPRPNEPVDRRLMPVLVHTTRAHFQERLALRRSWGSLPIYKKWVLRFVFLLGEPDRNEELPDMNQTMFEEEDKRLQEESSKYGDLVIGNFKDTYHNLTYKHLMGYKWILNYCAEATFVLKVDDDVFVDIMRWLDWRTMELETVAANNSAIIPEYYCYIFMDKPIRDNSSKWYVSVEDWPYKNYPDRCSGWAYSLTVPLLQKIYSVSNDFNFFWIDDVFVTGILMEVAKMKFHFKPESRIVDITWESETYRSICESQNWNAPRKFDEIVSVDRGDLLERDIMCLWNKTMHDSRNTGSNLRTVLYSYLSIITLLFLLTI